MARRFVLALTIVLTLLAPSVAKAQTAADAIAADVDAWWNAQFAARGLPYSSPRLELVSEPGTEFCDFIDLFYAPAGYCATNQTITVSTGFVSPDNVAALLPLQPERIELGSIGSLYVNVIVSPVSRRPAVPVPFAAARETRVGAVVSIVKVHSALVPVLPALSVCVARAV